MAQKKFDLQRPIYQGLELPSKILKFLGGSSSSIAPPETVEEPVALDLRPRLPIAHTLAEYVAFIRSENAARHAENKVAHLRGFFGPGLLGTANGEIHFTGTCLEDVKVNDVRRYIEGLNIGTKTRRHYRETFHHLFEYAMKCEFLIPTNFRYPNPMGALPSYLSKNQVIRYLTPQEKENLFRVLAPFPSVHAGARLMIEAGLRRAEALWLPRQALSEDLTYMSIVNQIDPASDVESSLKTGSRPVTILPPLREFLQDYLPTLNGDWLVPSPTGKQWHGDNFGDAHREALQAAGLDYTCLVYRHTYATERAKSGWSLFRIAKEMGNSVAVAEKYYAAFVNPNLKDSG